MEKLEFIIGIEKRRIYVNAYSDEYGFSKINIPEGSSSMAFVDFMQKNISRGNYEIVQILYEPEISEEIIECIGAGLKAMNGDKSQIYFSLFETTEREEVA